MVQGFSEQHKNPLFYSDLANNPNGERRGPKRFWMWGWPVCHRIGWNPIITEVINITCNCTMTVHHNTNLRQHEWGEANYHIPTGTARTCTVTAAWQPLENGSKSPGDVDYGPWHSEKGGLLLEAKKSFNFHIKEGTERHEQKKRHFSEWAGGIHTCGFQEENHSEWWWSNALSPQCHSWSPALPMPIILLLLSCWQNHQKAEHILRS